MLQGLASIKKPQSNPTYALTSEFLHIIKAIQTQSFTRENVDPTAKQELFNIYSLPMYKVCNHIQLNVALG